MAVSQIEEKILGRLARETAPSNPLLSASLYQVLGLSILLSRKLYRARRVRKLDVSRNTKSLQLYHQIIWLAREGLSITEVYILPYCRDGEQGPECQVMAAKLRASLYHVFCLFHNHPPVQQLSPGSAKSSSSNNSSSPPGKAKDDRRPTKSPRNGRDNNRRRRRKSKNALRDPIPSMTSNASYITNPYTAAGVVDGQSRIPGSPEARRTPSRPPGLKHIDITPAQAAASFLLPPLNFVPMAKEYFETAQQLADSLLSAASGLRLSISLEHSAFMWDCEKLHEAARKVARQAIRDVYASTDGLDDDEFADASALVQALGGIVRRGLSDSAARPAKSATSEGAAPKSNTSTPPLPPTAPESSSASTAGRRSRIPSPSQQRSFTRTPERLSTVPEDPSQETSETTAPTTLSPPASRTSNRSRSRGKLRPGSSASTSEEKAAKRRAVEAAEELYRLRTSSADKIDSQQQKDDDSTPATITGIGSDDNLGNEKQQVASPDAVGDDVDGSRAHSRQNTPPEGLTTSARAARAPASHNHRRPPQKKPLTASEILARPDGPQQQADDQRLAVLEALKVISSASGGSRRSKARSGRAQAAAVS